MQTRSEPKEEDPIIITCRRHVGGLALLSFFQHVQRTTDLGKPEISLCPCFSCLAIMEGIDVGEARDTHDASNVVFLCNASNQNIHGASGTWAEESVHQG